MPKLTKIYTRTGDAGTTALGGGQRVPKDHLRVQVYGTVDETNSHLGLAVAAGVCDRLAQVLPDIQNQLFDLGSDLCFLEEDKGKWTLPAGFMELGETTLQGAARETDEEAGARFEMESLFSVLSVPRVGQVHLFYRARLLSDRFDPGFETIEARLFAESEIPWDEIAFRTVRETLMCYFADRRAGRFQVHTIDID